MPIFPMLRIFERCERTNTGQASAGMDWSRSTHASHFACAFEALAAVVETIRIEVKILYCKSWVVMVDQNVRVSIAIAEGL